MKKTLPWSLAKKEHKPSLNLVLALFILLSFAASVCLTLKMPTAGAWLTQAGDWQNLSGEYTIGIINYDVEIGKETLMTQDQTLNVTKYYNLIVPINGAVKMYDDFADTKNPPAAADIGKLRADEFNKGVTIMHLRFINKSDSPITISALLQQTANTGNINFLPLPLEITEDNYKTLNYYDYVMTTLKNPANLTELNTNYNTYYGGAAQKGFSSDLGTINGVSTTQPGSDEGDYIFKDNKYYFVNNAYAIAWAEYGNGEYNKVDANILKRESEFLVSLVVGQLE